MRIRDLMSSPVETAVGAESAESAYQRMCVRHIRHLVVMSGRQVVGIVSSRDLESLGSLRSVQSIDETMVTPVVTARPETTLRAAANLLRGRTIGCLPVTEDGKLVGIVTTTDLLEAIGRGAERPVSKGKRPILKSRGPRRKSLPGRRDFAGH